MMNRCCANNADFAATVPFSKALVKDASNFELAQSMKMDCFKQENKRYFKLSCLYFNKFCTVYFTSQRPPHACETFICQLIRDYRKKKVSFDFAMEKIKDVRARADLLLQEMGQISALKNIPISNLKKVLFKLHHRHGLQHQRIPGTPQFNDVSIRSDFLQRAEHVLPDQQRLLNRRFNAIQFRLKSQISLLWE